MIVLLFLTTETLVCYIAKCLFWDIIFVYIAEVTQFSLFTGLTYRMYTSTMQIATLRWPGLILSTPGLILFFHYIIGSQVFVLVYLTAITT
uniref:Uncharacterized protein n=1 Tax=Pyxicephalus adspersus TaxID=30357 RepID=A0AAV3B0L9_PYXAD|nr:TPA: hypothetical protein GDO54_000105 [Pyxicephalus adspersus]